MTDGGLANHPPWTSGLAPRAPYRAPDTDLHADVAIVGAGIAGVATAHFVLQRTGQSVVLIDAERVAGGATGHNAGQLVTYFERPLRSIVETFGFERALTAQREVDESWALLDELLAFAGIGDTVNRFTGHMGMWSENHLLVHLGSNRLRQQAGLATERCLVSDHMPLGAKEREYADLFEVVPHARIRELLETRDDRYRAVLSFQKGTADPVKLCERVLAELRQKHGERFVVEEGARASHITLAGDGATLVAGRLHVRAQRVVLCTNGYRGLEIANPGGETIDPVAQQELHGTIAFMAAYFVPRALPPSAISYLASPRIGEGQAYYYITRRPYWDPSGTGTLVAIGGPDRELAEWADYEPELPIEPGVLQQIDGFLRRVVLPETALPAAYPWSWHGLMGYTRDGVRVIGADPRNPALLYNLGCNGVGLLPSIAGGLRIARILAGEAPPASAFDPS